MSCSALRRNCCTAWSPPAPDRGGDCGGNKRGGGARGWFSLPPAVADDLVVMIPHRRPDSIEIAGLSGAVPTSRSERPARTWLGVFFKCCHVYSRVYRNASGTAYSGRCPRCGGAVTARVGPGGTSRRIFFAE